MERGQFDDYFILCVHEKADEGSTLPLVASHLRGEEWDGSE